MIRKVVLKYNEQLINFNTRRYYTNSSEQGFEIYSNAIILEIDLIDFLDFDAWVIVFCIQISLPILFMIWWNLIMHQNQESQSNQLPE